MSAPTGASSEPHHPVLIAGATTLAAVTGFASLNAPAASGDDAAKAATQQPVERTTLLCPQPSTSEIANTSYTSYTPVTQGAADSGKAELQAAAVESADSTSGKKTGKKTVKPALKPAEPGKPATGDGSGAEPPASSAPPRASSHQTDRPGDHRGRRGHRPRSARHQLRGSGHRVLVPGRGSPPPAGADYVHLTNPDNSAAIINVEMYGKDGTLKSTVGNGITVQPHASEPILLSTLASGQQTDSPST